MSTRWIAWVGGVMLLVAVVLATRHFSEARDFAALAQHANPWWLVLAVVLQVGTYLSQGQVFRSVASAGHSHLSLSAACRLSLAKLFVDQAVPSGGWSGSFLLVSGLQRRAMPRRVVAAAVVVELVSRYIAYAVGLAVALATAARGEARRIILPVALVFCLFAIAVSVLVLAVSGRAVRTVPHRFARLRPIRMVLDFVKDADPNLARNIPLLLKASVYQLGIVLFDAATVMALIRSLGGNAAPGGVFASFMISNLLRTIGFIPGGLGAFEAASVVTLRAVGLPLAMALAATLLYRGLSFWLPMLPGLWLARQEMGRPRIDVSP